MILTLLALPLAAQQPTIALIGLRHSHTWGHLESIVKSSPAKLVAISETDPELIAEARKLTAPDVRYFDDYVKLLDQVKPTMVWAFVENNRHHEVVLACAPRKIHVIFEKPLAATFQQAELIRTTARKHGIQVLTNFSPAFTPAYYAIKAKLDTGALGAPWRLRVTTGHGGVFPKSGRSRIFHEWLIDPVKNGAGALMDFGCYNVLYSLYFLGRPTSVYAYALHLRPADFPLVEDGVTMVLTYPKAVAILEQSWDLPPNSSGFEIVTYQGAIRMQDGKLESRSGREPAVPLAAPPLPLERSSPIAYMVHCLAANRPVEGLVSLDYTVAVNEIIDAAKRSIRSGKPVSLPPARP
ncbi:MAG: Gfo/Idh/MocA family oxidoreductase [Acidobacteria bacterium]|nr:Gfo/Idh/MocA family oxidoreductase [Acidobacteriota bacterium]